MKETHNDRIKMKSDKYYIVIASFGAILSFSVTLFTCLFIAFYGSGNTEVIVFLSMLELFGLFSISLGYFTTVYTIELTKDGMYIKKYLKKGFLIKYSDLTYVTKVFDYKSPYVKDNNLVRYYIVLSKNEIHEYYKDRAFGLVLSPELIKLEFTKEKYDILYNILPEHQRNQLVEQFSDLVEK